MSGHDGRRGCFPGMMIMPTSSICAVGFRHRIVGATASVFEGAQCCGHRPGAGRDRLVRSLRINAPGCALDTRDEGPPTGVSSL